MWSYQIVMMIVAVNPNLKIVVIVSLSRCAKIATIAQANQIAPIPKPLLKYL